jgi:hypothetical protein
MRKNQLVTGGFQYDFTDSQAASCMHFQYVKIAAVVSLKRVTKRFSKLVSNLKGASQNFEFDFFINVETKIVKPSVHVHKVPTYNYKPSNKYLFRTNPIYDPSF